MKYSRILSGGSPLHDLSSNWVTESKFSGTYRKHSIKLKFHASIKLHIMLSLTKIAWTLVAAFWVTAFSSSESLSEELSESEPAKDNEAESKGVYIHKEMWKVTSKAH